MSALRYRWCWLFALISAVAISNAGITNYPIVFYDSPHRIDWDWAGNRVRQVIPPDKIDSVHVFRAAFLHEKRLDIEKVIRKFLKGNEKFAHALHLLNCGDTWEAVVLTSDGKVFCLCGSSMSSCVLVTSEGKSGVVFFPQ